jgi:hypothetical protein
MTRASAPTSPCLYARPTGPLCPPTHSAAVGWGCAQSRFPVIQRQWDAVSHFRTQILSRARAELLRTPAGESAPPAEEEEAVAATLAAILLLDRLAPAAVLDELLRARTAGARAALEEADVPVADRLRRAYAVVATTLRHIRALFLPGSEGGAGRLEALLGALSTGHVRTAAPAATAAVAAAAAGAAGAAGGAQPLSPPVTTERSFLTGLFGNRSTVHALLRYLPASVQRYTPYLGTGARAVPPEAVVAATATWVHELGPALRPGLQRALGTLASGAELAAVIDASAADAGAREAESGWAALCGVVLSRAEDGALWTRLLQPELDTRATSLIQAATAAVPPQFALAVRDAIAAPEPDLARYVWSRAGAKAATALAAAAAEEELAGRAPYAAALGWRARALDPTVHTVVASFSAALQSLQANVAPLLGSTHSSKVLTRSAAAKEHRARWHGEGSRLLTRMSLSGGHVYVQRPHGAAGHLSWWLPGRRAGLSCTAARPPRHARSRDARPGRPQAHRSAVVQLATL